MSKSTAITAEPHAHVAGEPPYHPDVAHRVEEMQRIALVVGVVGLVAGGVLALLTQDLRAQFFRSYLWAFTFWLGIPLGCLVVLMIQHLTGGAWGYALRRLLEATTRTLPLLFVLFLPLAFGLGYVYLWADPAVVAIDPNLQHKAKYYLTPTLVNLRVPIYFLIWIGLALVLNRWSRQEDAGGINPAETRRFRLLSAPGIGLYGLAITFASIDWVMSLDPHWYSTIYGPMFAMGQVVSGMTFVLIVAMCLRYHTVLGNVLTAHVMRDCGNLLLAFIMVWTYLSFSQFLLMWSGNLPEEIPWYLERSQHGWQWVAWLLFLFHFAVPFALLLSRQHKQDPNRLRAIATLVLVMEALNLYWLIMPSFGSELWEGSPLHPGVFSALLTGAATFAGIGGLWLATFLWQLGQMPLLPVHGFEAAEGDEHD